MTHPAFRFALSAVLAGVTGLVHAQTDAPPTLGQMLYSTHCVTCHTTQMHWRANRKATDWDSLKDLVRGWQGRAGLQWSDVEVNEVSRHLNDTIYKFPQTADRVGLLRP